MMKKVFSLVLIALLMASSAFAIELQAGVKTDVTINKELRTDKSDVVVDFSAQNYDVYTDIKVGDALTISPKAGLTTNSIDIDDATLEGGIGWNVGVDGKLNLFKSSVVDIDGIASYRFSRVDVDDVQVGNLEFSNPIETITTLNEWEIGAIVSKNLAELLPNSGVTNITPYFGMVYSDARGETEANLSVLNVSEQLEAEQNFGLRTGIGFEPLKDVKMNLNVKLVDETAICGAVSCKF